jgi:hypothetical protein
VQYLRYAKHRLRAFLSLVDKVASSDFAHENGKHALARMRERVRDLLSQLENDLDPNHNSPEVIKQACRVALEKLFVWLPRLGFILRSTNVRNAFEITGPFLRLADDVLRDASGTPDDSQTDLILSSEWDYSPFTYALSSGSPELMIGLPAPESDNPLLFPLAGHELGHSVWARRGLAEPVRQKVRKLVVRKVFEEWQEYTKLFSAQCNRTLEDIDNDIFVVQSWQRAYEWTQRQAQETFCDFFGLSAFRASFLSAFAYLFAPGPKHRDVGYPSLRARIDNMCYAAKSLMIEVPSEYDALFVEQTSPSLVATDAFNLKIADAVLLDLRPDLLELARSQSVTSGSRAGVQAILSRFRLVVPAEDCKCLADILNAAWEVFESEDTFWKDIPGVRENAFPVLRDLVLKTIEVFEIEEILRDAHAAKS